MWLLNRLNVSSLDGSEGADISKYSGAVFDVDIL